MTRYNPVELQRLHRLKTDLPFFCSQCLRIKLKGGGDGPFILNRAQRYLHERMESQLARTGMVRMFILKGRQQGISTYIAARFYHKASWNIGKRVFILSHHASTTGTLFQIVDKYYNVTPPAFRPGQLLNNNRQMIFDNESQYTVGTAGTGSIARGDTTQLLHWSEVAYSENVPELLTGVVQTVADVAGTEIANESTAHGIGDFFHRGCMAALAGELITSDVEAEQSNLPYELVFIPWYWNDEYRADVPAGFKLDEYEHDLKEMYKLDDQQIQWRRNKIAFLKLEGFGEKKFRQEYPCITGDARVSTQRGLVRLDAVVEGDTLPQGDVLAVLPKGVKSVYRITTETGRTVTGTGDHPIQLTNGEFECLSQSMGCDVALSPVVFGDEYQTVTYSEIPCCQTAVRIDEDWGLLLGLFVGDGSIYGHTFSIVFDAKDQNAIAWTQQTMYRFFGRAPETRRVSENGIEVRMSVERIVPFLEAAGLTRSNPESIRSNVKRNVCVPEAIWRSPKTVVREFLRGVFDADGFVDKQCARIMFFAKREDFIRDVQLLLQGFGVESSIRKEVKKANNGSEYTGHSLRIGSAGAKVFAETIGFLSDRKVARSQERPKTSQNAATVYTNRVVSIAYAGEAPVFDLTVPRTSTFNANGMVVHNCTVLEAFQASGDSLIDPMLIDKARKSKLTDRHAPLVVSCDPARDGDRTVITWRRGRHIEQIKIFNQMNEMLLAGKLANIITQDNPDMVFVDITGGTGNGAVDRLKELKFQRMVQGVKFSAKPNDERYLNKRAEMAGLLKEWFQDEGGCRIPDDEEVGLELGVIPSFDGKETSRGLLQLESKANIKKLFGKSPDIFDSVMLGFAQPVRRTDAGPQTSNWKARTTHVALEANRSRIGQKPLPNNDPSNGWTRRR